MPEEKEFSYDVFISYRWISPDQEWVREQLYPALMESGLKVCLDVEDFIPGRDLILEMERAGTNSKHVLCILTPEYFLEGRMVEFESLSARRRDPGGRNSSIIPLVLRETKIPDRISGLIPINWINQKEQSREWRKLMAVLGATNSKVAPPSAIQPDDAINLASSGILRYDEDEVEDLDEEDWTFLLDTINDQSCTPIIGPGIYSDAFPFKTLISDWTESPDYPFSDLTNLTMAAQFRSLIGGAIVPKGRIANLLKNLDPPDFRIPNELHRILAGLPLPCFVTTNYDDFFFKALQFREKQPRRDLCRWDDPLHCEEFSIFNTGYQPDVSNPVIFHLFGYSINKKALVVTEDDYLDFLVNVSRHPRLIPPRIQESFTDASILLIGYRFDDWDFRILSRALVSYLKHSPYQVHISVQLVPGALELNNEQIRNAKNYFKRYLKNHNIRVSWKTSYQFIEELKKRWNESPYGLKKPL